MRTKKELEKRILELEKQVKNYDFMIELIQRQLDNQQQFPVFPPISIGDGECIDVNGHDYPNPWHSITAPHCRKCGKQAKTYDITFGGDKTGDAIPPLFTTTSSVSNCADNLDSNYWIKK